MPIVKDKSGKLASKDNYRPVALASLISKVLEIVIFKRLEDFIETGSNPFGFKKSHSTDMCIYTLKELISHYRKLGSNVYLCFLDASKAFDRVNHGKLFQKLINRGVPEYLVRILSYWYKQQQMFVRWGNQMSDGFTVTNGVRQGGILSPYLFNVYMDDLSIRLNRCRIGCYCGNIIINHLMYADDLVLISPSSKGMSVLLEECNKYGLESDIKYNGQQSAIVVVENSKKNVCHPVFTLGGEIVERKEYVKYLGHIISRDLSDDLDIKRQLRCLYVQGNILSRRFAHCSGIVKMQLFRSYCSAFYTANLWCNFKKGIMNRFVTAYNNVYRSIIGVPKYCSASQMVASTNMPC